MSLRSESLSVQSAKKITSIQVRRVALLVTPRLASAVVARAAGKERPAPRWAGRVDEVAGEHDPVEAAPEVQPLNVG
jgi:hypothetical protein